MRGRKCHRGGARGERLRKVGRWLLKANRFLRRTKIGSRAAALYGRTNLPYAQQVAQAGLVAAKAGYGLRLAGGTRKRRCARRCRRR